MRSGCTCEHNISQYSTAARTIRALCADIPIPRTSCPFNNGNCKPTWQDGARRKECVGKNAAGLLQGAAGKSEGRCALQVSVCAKVQSVCQQRSEGKMGGCVCVCVWDSVSQRGIGGDGMYFCSASKHARGHRQAKEQALTLRGATTPGQKRRKTKSAMPRIIQRALRSCHLLPPLYPSIRLSQTSCEDTGNQASICLSWYVENLLGRWIL